MNSLITYLDRKDIPRLQTIAALCQDIGGALNDILRRHQYGDRTRMKREICKYSRFRKDIDFKITEARLGGSTSITFYLVIEEDPDRSKRPLIKVTYNGLRKCVDLQAVNIRDIKLIDIIVDLKATKEILRARYDADKSLFGKYTHLPALVIKDENGRITEFRHGRPEQDSFDKFYFIYAKLIEYPELSEALPNFRVNRKEKTIEYDCLMKDSYGYADIISKLIVGDERPSKFRSSFLPTGRELNKAIKTIHEKNNK